MKKNMGNTDKFIRSMIAVIVLLMYFTGQWNGILGTIGMILSFVFLITSVLGFCPLYLPLGISTRKKG